MNNLILMGITGPNKSSYLSELIEPVKHYFDRIIWGFHKEGDDDGYDYLKSVGEVINLKWCGRLDLSRNVTLHYSNLETGDVVILLDDLERIRPEFFELLSKYKDQLFSQAEIFLLNGKRFMFKYSEWLYFAGNPHEGLHGSRLVSELSNIEPFKDVNSYFYNVRDEIRDEFHWIGHYAKYYLYPSSNHILLGCEDRPDLVQKRAQIRGEFLIYLDSIGIEKSVDSLIGYWKSGKPSLKMLSFLNSEKILNDLYRYEVLEEKTLKDDHDYVNFEKIWN